MEELFLEPGKNENCGRRAICGPVALGTQPSQFGSQQGGNWRNKTSTSARQTTLPKIRRVREPG